MEVKEILSEDLKRILEITYPAKEIEEKYNKELTTQQATFKMKGFRAGKAPSSKAQAMLGPKIKNDVINKAIYESSHNFLKENNLKPFTEPEIIITSNPEDGQDLKYTMSFELTPIIPLIDPTSLTITKYIPVISNEDVEKHINQLISQSYDYEIAPPNHKAQLKDKVELDFEGKIKDRPFKGGSSTNFQVVIGQNKIIADLEEGLIGVIQGEEKDITASFPADYHDSNLRDKTAVFSITVKNIFCPRNLSKEEVIKKFNYKDETAFNDDMQKHLEHECNRISESFAKKDLIKIILSTYCDMQVPSVLIEQEKKFIANSASTESNPNIVERVKLGLLFNQFGSQHKINLSPAEVTNRLARTLDLYSGGNTQYKDYLYNLYIKDMDLLMKLGSEIMEEKIFEQLLGQVNKVEQTITADELIIKEKNDYTDEPSTDSNRSN